MKKQIVVVGGGDSFRSKKEFLDFLENFEVTIGYFRPRRDWKSFLQERLGDDYDVLVPAMPNKQNARFAEWKLWFEKLLPFVENGATLIGHSLGGMFLVKYLAENDFSKKIGALILIAAPHNRTGEIGDFVLPASIARVSKLTSKIYLLYSKDDKVVPFAESGIYKKQLPEAELIAFEDRGHFNQLEFPELIELIKNA